jgi:hypothetical protein
LKANVLTATGARACNIRAVKAESAGYKSATASAVTIFFGFKNQAALILKAASTSAKHSSRVAVSTIGGSGSGGVSYRASGGACSIAGSSVTASKPTTYLLTASKAWSAAYLPTTSKPVTLRFS